MRLSDKLKQDEDSGDFGKALDGYHLKAKELEVAIKNLLDVYELCEAGVPPDIELRLLVVDKAKAALGDG